MKICWVEINLMCDAFVRLYKYQLLSIYVRMCYGICISTHDVAQTMFAKCRRNAVSKVPVDI